jgi:hypothetical protein
MGHRSFAGNVEFDASALKRRFGWLGGGFSCEEIQTRLRRALSASSPEYCQGIVFRLRETKTGSTVTVRAALGRREKRSSMMQIFTADVAKWQTQRT